MATYRKSKTKYSVLAAQTDPSAPLDSAVLLKAAAPVFMNTAVDLSNRTDSFAPKCPPHRENVQKRTDDNYDIWRRDSVEQAVVCSEKCTHCDEVQCAEMRQAYRAFGNLLEG
jgi:hypothetical protein